MFWIVVYVLFLRLFLKVIGHRKVALFQLFVTLIFSLCPCNAELLSWVELNRQIRLCCYVTSCYVVLPNVVLCYVMLCYVMLCYVMLSYVMLWKPWKNHEKSFRCLKMVENIAKLNWKREQRYWRKQPNKKRLKRSNSKDQISNVIIRTSITPERSRDQLRSEIWLLNKTKAIFENRVIGITLKKQF